MTGQVITQQLLDANEIDSRVGSALIVKILKSQSKILKVLQAALIEQKWLCAI